MAKDYLNKIAERGQLIVVSGPNGVGKRTVIRRYLKEHPNAITATTATTRDPREGETEGVEHFFLSELEFDRLVRTGQMLHYSFYQNRRYGTPKETVEQARNKGHNVIVDVDVMGAMKIRALCPDATLIFVMPPSWEELEARLRKRATNDEETIQKFLEMSKEDIVCAGQYDYIIVNDTVEKAVSRFAQIVHGNRYSKISMKSFLESYIEEEIVPLTDCC
ncbi:guanylate kinase [Hespellia stercorisuis]|uniref:Guanylate kinase n=1 Tax=Hespellia stercorisuis DSM 15480 TaxID=1121950 RepID=A0A1M6K701_9FIRM|nr:guanylate kinase [Hespellia stercorisuis]SHJ54732.1 guanylate kinase [Hespellia stercorisuis DSM 15480]